MRFSAPVQTGPEAHPAFSAMGTLSFPELNKPGLGVSHPLPSRAKFKEQVSYSSTPTLCFQGRFWGKFYCYKYFYLLLQKENVCCISLKETISRLILLFRLIFNHSFSHIPILVIKINWIRAPSMGFFTSLSHRGVLYPAWAGIYKVKIQG
jgi:hypothetical protein